MRWYQLWFLLNYHNTINQSYLLKVNVLRASQVALAVKNPPANAGDLRDVSWEDPFEESIATHSSILGWRILMERGAWRATVPGVAKDWTWLKWLGRHAHMLNTLQMPFVHVTVEFLGQFYGSYMWEVNLDAFRTLSTVTQWGIEPLHAVPRDRTKVWTLAFLFIVPSLNLHVLSPNTIFPLREETWRVLGVVLNQIGDEAGT